MSVTLSPTLGALYVCHFIITSLLWTACALSMRACQDVFLSWHDLRMKIFFIEINVTVWSDTNNTVVRSWLQSAYILQSSEVVSSISPVEFVSITPCVYAHVGAS